MSLNCSIKKFFPVDDPDLIGVWEEDKTLILFFHKPKKALVEKLCHRHGCRLFYEADVDYQDWHGHKLDGKLLSLLNKY